MLHLLDNLPGTACGGGILYPPVALRRQPPLGKGAFVKKEFFTHEVWQGSRAPNQNLRFCKWVRFLYIKATGIVRRIDE